MRQNGESPLTLFVVHWNRPLECRATVLALLAQAPEMRVVILDNASEQDAFAQLERELGARVEYLRLIENKGWGGALNVALSIWVQEAGEAFCLISAHDAEPAKGCVPLLVRAAQAETRAGIVCPQYPDGSVPHLSSTRGVFYSYRELPSGQEVQEVDVPHGTLMLVRKSCLAEIGLFDERFFAYGDEHELGARARRSGWKVLLVWGATVVNPGTWTSSPLRSYLFARNSLLLVRLHYGLMAAALRAFLILVNTLRLRLTAPRAEFAFSARARLSALRDFVLGRFGLPPWAR